MLRPHTVRKPVDSLNEPAAASLCSYCDGLLHETAHVSIAQWLLQLMVSPVTRVYEMPRHRQHGCEPRPAEARVSMLNCGHVFHPACLVEMQSRDDFAGARSSSYHAAGAAAQQRILSGRSIEGVQRLRCSCIMQHGRSSPSSSAYMLHSTVTPPVMQPGAAAPVLSPAETRLLLVQLLHDAQLQLSAQFSDPAAPSGTITDEQTRLFALTQLLYFETNVALPPVAGQASSAAPADSPDDLTVYRYAIDRLPRAPSADCNIATDAQLSVDCYVSLQDIGNKLGYSLDWRNLVSLGLSPLHLACRRFWPWSDSRTPFRYIASHLQQTWPAVQSALFPSWRQLDEVLKIGGWSLYELRPLGVTVTQLLAIGMPAQAIQAARITLGDWRREFQLSAADLSRIRVARTPDAAVLQAYGWTLADVQSVYDAPSVVAEVPPVIAEEPVPSSSRSVTAAAPVASFCGVTAEEPAAAVLSTADKSSDETGGSEDSD